MAKQHGFPAIATVGRIDSFRADDGEPAKHKVRYFLASRMVSPRSCSQSCGPLDMENNLRWILYAVFDEGACRSRKDHAPKNLAIIRKLATNMLRATLESARISHKML